MFLFQGNLEEDVLLTLLSTSPVSTDELIRSLKKSRGRITKQGIYRVLRKLKQEEKIVRYKTFVSISDLWIERLKEVLRSSHKTSFIGNLALQEQAQRSSVKAVNLITVDQIWSDIFLTLERQVAPRHALFLYNPHNWSSILRRETDALHVRTLQRKKRRIYLVIGAETVLDKETRDIAKQDGFEVALDPSLKTKDFVAVIGDYLITLKLLKNGSDLIHQVFLHSTPPNARASLQHIIPLVKGKITVERNKRKADIWKKKLTKHFSIGKTGKDLWGNYF